MIIEPKVREYICTTAHPQGCAESVRNQADYACKQGMVNGTKKALIIGCSAPRRAPAPQTGCPAAGCARCPAPAPSRAGSR